jgi:phosphopantothenoylcysteine decarboxylase/phosphopantothenate--cysteine ligase
MSEEKRVLLIISGGIAAYKCLEVIRRLKDHNISTRAILTKSGSQFVTPLSIASLSGEKVFQDLFDLTDEQEMGHIRLSREAGLVLVAPATANIMARMAAGITDDLATTALLATDKPVMVAPAMNPMMWEHPATQANMALLKKRGVEFIEPGSGDMACGEVGAGRLAEPDTIVARVIAALSDDQPLKGKPALVTAGPTQEAIDPVRYISNHSSGKQGYAIADALAKAGASVTLISGPTKLAAPANVNLVSVTTADEMLAASKAALPADIAIFAAAVADYKVSNAASQKIKKKDGKPPKLEFEANPDILATISSMEKARPDLVIGFAAETENLIENAQEKLDKKGCDWILANDVSPASGTFGGDSSEIHLVTSAGSESWGYQNKESTANTLLSAILDLFEDEAPDETTC